MQNHPVHFWLHCSETFSCSHCFIFLLICHVMLLFWPRVRQTLSSDEDVCFPYNKVYSGCTERRDSEICLEPPRGSGQTLQTLKQTWESSLYVVTKAWYPLVGNRTYLILRLSHLDKHCNTCVNPFLCFSRKVTLPQSHLTLSIDSVDY